MKNLHIALIMDSSNQEFSVQCESNPALYKKCSVLWMEGWARDTMIQVGSVPPIPLPDSLARFSPSSKKGKEQRYLVKGKR